MSHANGTHKGAWESEAGGSLIMPPPQPPVIKFPSSPPKPPVIKFPSGPPKPQRPPPVGRGQTLPPANRKPAAVRPVSAPPVPRNVPKQQPQKRSVSPQPANRGSNQSQGPNPARWKKPQPFRVVSKPHLVPPQKPVPTPRVQPAPQKRKPPSSNFPLGPKSVPRQPPSIPKMVPSPRPRSAPAPNPVISRPPKPFNWGMSGNATRRKFPNSDEIELRVTSLRARELNIQADWGDMMKQIRQSPGNGNWVAAYEPEAFTVNVFGYGSCFYQACLYACMVNSIASRDSFGSQAGGFQRIYNEFIDPQYGKESRILGLKQRLWECVDTNITNNDSFDPGNADHEFYSIYQAIAAESVQTHDNGGHRQICNEVKGHFMERSNFGGTIGSLLFPKVYGISVTVFHPDVLEAKAAAGPENKPLMLMKTNAHSATTSMGNVFRVRPRAGEVMNEHINLFLSGEGQHYRIMFPFGMTNGELGKLDPVNLLWNDKLAPQMPDIDQA